MENALGRQPTKQEMQRQMKELVEDVRRSVAATPQEFGIATRTPRQTLPLVHDAPRRPS
jgi:hypothetical protein